MKCFLYPQSSSLIIDVKFNFQYDAILTKEQLVLTKIMSSFEVENMQTQYNGLSCRINLYFHDYNLTIEIVENGHRNRSIDCEIKRQKAIEEQIGCKFIRIDLDKEDFDIFRTISKKFRHMKQSNYRINLYFHDYNLAIEIDENRHKNRNIDYKIKRQKAIEEGLGCKFIRIDPDKEDFDIFRTINKKFCHMKQSTKEIIIKKISTILLRLEFNPIKDRPFRRCSWMGEPKSTPSSENLLYIYYNDETWHNYTLPKEDAKSV